MVASVVLGESLRKCQEEDRLFVLFITRCLPGGFSPIKGEWDRRRSTVDEVHETVAMGKVVEKRTLPSIVAPLAALPHTRRDRWSVWCTWPRERLDETVQRAYVE